MHAIHITAALTTALALAIFAPMLRAIVPKDVQRRFGLLTIVGLWMSPLAYHFVRLPLKAALEQWLQPDAWTSPAGQLARDILLLSYAPLTEEPAKLIPWLILLAFGARLPPAPNMVVPLALASGLSFAIGEFWLVASFVAADPKFTEVPWYLFGGYMSERLMTCLTHSLFCLPVFLLASRGRAAALAGLLIAMLLHFAGNAPIMLMRREAFGLTSETWSVLVQLWLLLFVVTAVVVLAGVQFGRQTLTKIFCCRMICPGCGATYRQPILLGLNMGHWRYERCAVCRKWHWVTLANLAPLPDDPVSSHIPGSGAQHEVPMHDPSAGTGDPRID